jgi:hypothetical protein
MRLGSSGRSSQRADARAAAPDLGRGFSAAGEGVGGGPGRGRSRDLTPRSCSSGGCSGDGRPDACSHRFGRGSLG